MYGGALTVGTSSPHPAARERGWRVTASRACDLRHALIVVAGIAFARPVHASPPLAAAAVGVRPDTVLLVVVLAGVAALVSWLAGVCARSRREVTQLNLALERQVQQLRGLFEIVPVGILVAHDAACRKITGNTAAVKLLGVPPDENFSLSGAAPDRAPFRVLRDGNTLPVSELPLQRAVARRNGIVTDEVEVELPDGRSYTVSCCATPIVGSDGEVTGAIGAFLDVTGRRKAAAALRASQERLRLAMNAASLHTWDWDFRSGLVHWSSGAEPFLGPSPGRFENIQEQFFAMVHPDDRAAVGHTLDDALRTRDAFDLQYRLHDGERERWVELKGKVFRDATGTPTSMMGVNFDVSERKRSEEERERLLASERAARAEADRAQRRLRRLADSRMIGVIFVEGDHVAEANDAFLDMLGYSRDDLAAGALRWHELSPADRLPVDREAFEELLTRGECTPYESELCRRDGARIPVLLGAALIQETPREIVAFALDITSRRRAEHERDVSLDRERAARVDAEVANRAKDDFLAVVSHELRSPLTAIRMWTGLLRREQPEADVATILDAIDRSTVAQTRVIDDLLDVSRIIAGKLGVEMKAVELGDVVAAAVDAMQAAANEAGVRLVASTEPGLVVEGDAARLEQVVSNLISNAIKFSPAGGDVHVRLAGGAEAVLSVRDRGKGIDASFLPHVFERFRQADASHTRENGGLGLGLAIVHHLVGAHGGRIAAESAGPGRGATFTVRLPLHAGRCDGASGRRRRRGPVPRSLAGLRVLVVDDDVAARESMTAVLRAAGARAIAVASAAAALETFEREAPHVLVTDIAMPLEDGFALLRRVRALGRGRGGDVPAAAVTAHAGRADRQLALARGFQAHLTKPIAPEDLVETVTELAAHGPEGSLTA